MRSEVGERAVEVLLHQQDREPCLAQVDHDLLQVLHHHRRKAFGRLVHQDQLGIDHQRAGDREHLPLAAGKLAAAMVPALGKSREQARRPVLDRPAFASPCAASAW